MSVLLTGPRTQVMSVTFFQLWNNGQATEVAAFGVLWVVKFVIFNELMFKHHPEILEDEPALDGRAGIPG